MGQSHRSYGMAYGTCDRCGKGFCLVARGRPYMYCSHECSITPLEERIAVNIKTVGDCVVWTGKKNGDGYGELQHNKRIVRVHRWSYDKHVGPIPAGMYVCHKCDTPACIKPDHLFLGTQTDNMRDMARKGRGVYPMLRGEEHGAAKLTNEAVAAIRECDDVQTVIAERFGISQTLVSAIKSRKIWKHVA